MKIAGIVGSKTAWLGLIAVAAVGGLSLGPGRWFGKEATEELRGTRVRRGPLRISVLQKGELAAKNSVSVKSEIEGQTTILQLVAQGTIVHPGDLLVRLDSSDLVEKELQQRIAADNADAAFKKAKAQYDIQVSQNQSDIEAAQRKEVFAQLDLKKYQEGDLEQLRKEAEDKILLARQTRTQAENTLTWSKTLHQKGFLTQTELDRDDLDFQSADVQLKQAELALELLQKYDDPRKQSELEADLVEARRGLERAGLQADARIADFQAALATSEVRLKLEKEKLLRYQTQIEKTRITSTVAGMVVYTQAEGGRMGMGEAVQEGTQVREGQEILTIPSTGGMIAQASIHESVLKQVAIGLPCTISVDALPGLTFGGKVRYVALLPDKGNWWANPTQRLYRTEVSIDEANAEMRPGMNCGIEILVEEIPDTVYVPLQSVLLSKGETIAFVAEKGRVEERRVSVGKQNDKWVQVLSGVAEGEEVLLSAPPGFAPQKNAEVEGQEGQGGGGDGAGKPAPSTPGSSDAKTPGEKPPEAGIPDAKTPERKMEGAPGRRGGGRRGDGKRPEGGPGGAGRAEGQAGSPAPDAKPASGATGAAGGAGKQ